MISQRVLKFATALTIVLLLGLIAYAVVVDSSRRGESGGNSSSVSLEMGTFAGQRSSRQASAAESSAVDGDSNSASKPREAPILRIGRIGSTPTRADVASISVLPLMESQIRRLYSLAKDKSCRVLAPGSAVVATLQPPKEGETRTIGRIPAVTVGLKMDPSGRSKLPKVTLGQVDDYFEKHHLSIQPIVYCDAMGQYYFGTDCQAAFFEVQRPSVALSPEPMINSAVSRFRALGVMSSTDESLAEQAISGRTLVMAFTFEKSDDSISGIAGTDRQANELLLFHLPENDTSDAVDESVESARDGVPLQVFITSDDRQNLHRLDLHDSGVKSPLPTISATVRFDKMILMGLYPAEPVVTKIDFRSAGIISMELVRRLMMSSSDKSSMSLGEILDQFGNLSSTQTVDRDIKTPAVGNDEDARWIEEIARQKYERLEQTLKPVEPATREMARPKVPLMSGLGD